MVLNPTLDCVPPEPREGCDVVLECLWADLLEVLGDVRPERARQGRERRRLLEREHEVLVLESIGLGVSLKDLRIIECVELTMVSM